jgi:hypothetical protein
MASNSSSTMTAWVPAPRAASNTARTLRSVPPKKDDRSSGQATLSTGSGVSRSTVASRWLLPHPGGPQTGWGPAFCCQQNTRARGGGNNTT